MTEKSKFDLGKCKGNPWSAQTFQSTTCTSFQHGSNYAHQISGLYTGQTEETVSYIITQIGMAFLLLGGFGMIASLIYHIMMNKKAMANAAGKRALGNDAKKMNTSINGSKRGKKNKKSLLAGVMSITHQGSTDIYERTSMRDSSSDHVSVVSAVDESYHSNAGEQIHDGPIADSSTTRDGSPRFLFEQVAPFKKQPPVVPSVYVKKSTEASKSWSINT